MTYQRISITPDLLEEEVKAAPVPPQQPRTELRQQQAPQSTREADIERLISQLEADRTDLTANYADWVKLGFAFADLGESGRYYFHRISSIYSGYDRTECDKQFDICLNSYDGSTRIESFFQYCKEAGQELRNPHSQVNGNGAPKQAQHHPPTPLQPPPEQQELTPDEQYQRLQLFRFNSDKPVPKPEPVISIDGHIIATPGNVITFVGQAKSGKSGIVAAILTGVLTLSGETVDTLGFTVERNEHGQAVIHIDSEQAAFNHYSGMMKVLHRAGRRTAPDWFHSYTFKSIDIGERMKALQILFSVLAKMHSGIHLAVIDGGADFVLDTNDLKESNAAIKAFEDLATEYNCTIVMILHFNPGSEKGRGHFGSQLERKSESVISVSKDEDSEISTIKGKLLRNSGNIPNLQFKYDVDLGYHVYCGTLTKVSKAETKLAGLRELAEAVFEDGLKQYTYTKLWERIAEAEEVKERAAQNRIKAMLQYDLIKKTDETEPIYSLAPKTANTA